MPTLSLCMIVKNEQKFLEQCLRSVQNLVDEIIIVDTGSTDKTKEIASKFTRKIYDFVWCDDFAAARNVSLAHATGDWILVLDADEVVAEQDHLAIRTLIANATADVSGFLLTQRNYFNSKEDLQLGSSNDLTVTAAGGELDFVSAESDIYQESKGKACWLPSLIVRLFRREEKVSFSGRVHEDVTSSLRGKIIPSAILVHHYGKCDLQVWKKKNELYLKLGKKKAEEQHDYYACFELGRQYLADQNGPPQLDKAKEMLEQSILLKSDFWLSWFNLGSVHLLQEDLNSARICLEKALEYNSQSPQIYLNLGVVYIKLKQYGEAVSVLIQGINNNPTRADLYKNLGLCYLEMGNEKEAVPILERAVELNPKYGKQFRFS